jgi:hypothetical protein
MPYFTGQQSPNLRKNIYQLVLKRGTTEASAQGLQKTLLGLRTKFRIELNLEFSVIVLI